MSGKKVCYKQNAKTGLFEGSESKEECSFLLAKADVNPKKGAVKKHGKKDEVYHGDELAIPHDFNGDVQKRCIRMFNSSREILAEHGRKYPDKDVAKYVGDGYWTGQASEYEADDKAETATGELYGHDHSAVAISRIFSYSTYPKVKKGLYVVVGDIGKEDGKIDIRKANDTGMYASYEDEKGVIQKYPHPTNIVDFHKGSLDKFCAKSNCGRQPIMMKICESIEEAQQVQKEMKVKIKKWRSENVTK